MFIISLIYLSFYYVKYQYVFNQCIKVPGDVAVKEADSKDSADVSNEVKPQQDNEEKSLVKREVQLSPDYVPVENKLKILTNDNVVVSHNSANQTNLQDKEVSRQVGEDLPKSREHYFDKQTNSNHSNSLADEGPKVEESIKIRDLKSNVKETVRQPSSLSSRSMKSFLSKQKSKHSRRSRLQVSQCLFCQVKS